MSAHPARGFVRRGAALASFALALGALPADAQNLLPDPRFNQGLGGFSAVAFSTIQWSAAPGADGAPGFGSLRVGGPASAIAGACVPVAPGRIYSWGASLNPRSAILFVTLYFYADGTCQGPALLSTVFGPAALNSNAWQFEPGPDATAPAGANSVQFTVIANVAINGSGGVDFDNVYFGSLGTLPPGVVDVPALSRPLALLLAAALAIAGLRFLRPA
jgi:hypothetical protein